MTLYAYYSKNKKNIRNFILYIKMIKRRCYVQKQNRKKENLDFDDFKFIEKQKVIKEVYD